MSEEVCGRIVYGNRSAPSLLTQAEPDDRMLVVNTFSKSWAMTGWRLGWITMPPELLPIFEKLIEFNTSGSPTFLQHAAVAAIRDGEPVIESFVTRCRAARDIPIHRLPTPPRPATARPRGTSS